jgi:hypothetical protein
VSLSGEQLQQAARDAAGALADVGHGRPFTPHLDVWKVADKVFLIVTDDDPDAQISRELYRQKYGVLPSQVAPLITLVSPLAPPLGLSVRASGGVAVHTDCGV